MRALIRFVRYIFSRVRGAKLSGRKLPSLVRAMDDLVPRRVMREVVASSHDRRQWGVLAAAWVGVSEREFFTAAANTMGVELEERIGAPDLTVYGGEARSFLSELRRVGAIIALDGEKVVRIIAVDPAEVRGLSCYDPSIPVSLASWSDIVRGLDAAERMILESENNSRHREAQRRNEVCGKILQIVIKEAAAHGSQSVEVITTEGKTCYQFTTSHGKVATGAIRSEVVHDLLQYLCSLEGSIIKSEAHGDVILRSLGSASNFRLSWGASVSIPASMSEEKSQVRSVTAIVPANSPPTVVEGVTGSPRPGVSEEYLRSENIEESPVLVIDDNPMFCRVLERLLRREGVNPCFAENGVVALEKLEAIKDLLPKVIICDLHMPVMNGREFLARIKGDIRLKTIPIIMLTSDDDIDAELQLLAGGADAFVSKAKDPRVLTAQIRRLIKPGGLQEAA